VAKGLVHSVAPRPTATGTRPPLECQNPVSPSLPLGYRQGKP
jgi:hypothetical protein